MEVPPPKPSSCWLRDHPVVQEIKAHGDISVQENAAIAVYFDLTEVKQWGGVSVYRCNTLNRIYVLATHPRTGSNLCIVPLSASTVITVQLLQQLFNSVQHHQLQHETTPPSKAQPTDPKAPPTDKDQLTLALVDNEGTVTYYHLHSGPPPNISPGTTPSGPPANVSPGTTPSGPPANVSPGATPGPVPPL